MASGELTAKAETGEFLVSDRSNKIVSPQKRQKKVMQQALISDPLIRRINLHQTITFTFF